MLCIQRYKFRLPCFSFSWCGVPLCLWIPTPSLLASIPTGSLVARTLSQRKTQTHSLISGQFSCPLRIFFLSPTPRSCTSIHFLWSQPLFKIDSLKDISYCSHSVFVTPPLCISPNLLLRIIFEGAEDVTWSHKINGFMNSSEMVLFCFHLFYNIRSTLHPEPQKSVRTNLSLLLSLKCNLVKWCFYVCAYICTYKLYMHIQYMSA